MICTKEGCKRQTAEDGSVEKNTIEKRKDLLDNLFYNREIAKYYQEIVEEKEGDLEKKIDAAIKKRNSSKIKK